MTIFNVNINATSTLIEKVWDTVFKNGLGGLLQPWQIRRVKKAISEAKASDIVKIAQAEKHAEDIKAGKKELLADGSIVDVQPLFDENKLLEFLAAPQLAMMLTRSINLVKTIDILHNEVSDSPTPVSNEPVGSDWFTNWRMHAESFSEEHHQRVWAAVLAAEVRQPGSYSILAMNILASVSSASEITFQNLCDMSFSNKSRTLILVSVPNPDAPGQHIRLDTLSNTMGEQLIGHGIEHFDLLSMRTAGLLASLPDEEYPRWDLLTREGVDFAGLPVNILPKSVDGRIHVISFTEAGHQLRSLIQKVPHKSYTPALKKLLADADVKFEFV